MAISSHENLEVSTQLICATSQPSNLVARIQNLMFFFLCDRISFKAWKKTPIRWAPYDREKNGVSLILLITDRDGAPPLVLVK